MKAVEVTTSVVFVESVDDPTWEHTVHAAVMDQAGRFEQLSSASRMRLIETIRRRGYPQAVLDYVPDEDDHVPRIFVRPRDGANRHGPRP